MKNENIIPEEYRNKMFFTANDLCLMLCISENPCYEFLKCDPPFRVFRIGNQIRVPAVSFWKWYFGEDDIGES